MSVDYALKSPGELSKQIADAIRGAIMNGSLLADQRLPSEGELCDRFAVSRPTVREALKRLAAQNLIRTQRGASGGAFVNRIRFEDAYDQQITTSTLLLSMNDVTFETACEARYVLELACLTLAVSRCEPQQIAKMRGEIDRQRDPTLTDEAFCASDVAFHRALVDSAQNPVISYQMAGLVEAMQPLMNMITFTARDREKIISFHTQIVTACTKGDAALAQSAILSLQEYTLQLASQISFERRTKSNADAT